MKQKEKEKKIPKNLYKNIAIWLGITILTVLYTYYMRSMSDDELFNYGFAVNILNGLTPYKDFNMIIPPFFHYITAIFIQIFGKTLLNYHILIAFMISSITMMCYKKIGRSAFAIHLLILTYPYTGYNIFCLFLLYILLTKEENKYSKIVDPLLIIMMILSKQTLGLLVIPSLIYAKNKKKTFLIYVTAALIFLTYLLIHNNLFQFIDYCILGMFDFTNKNNTGFNPLLLLEIIILIGLIYFYIKRKDKNILYVLMFQIVTFPIVDYYHFVITLTPVLYLIFYHFKQNPLMSHFALTIMISFFFAFNVGMLVQGDTYKFLSHYPIDNFMKGRLSYTLTRNYVTSAKKYLEEYSTHTPFILGHISYVIKLNHNIPINKFDIINNGNMGYHGAEKYQKEIEEYCQENKCIFFLNEREATSLKKIQTNKEILRYVMKNYTKQYSSTVFSVYTN